MNINEDNYPEWSQQIAYCYQQGILQCPVAGPVGTPCEMIQLHAPIGQKHVPFRIQRQGGRPALPSTVPMNSNEVLANVVIKPSAAIPMTDGSAAMCVEGHYEFALRVPLTDNDPLPYGRPPIPAAGNPCILPTDFVVGLLGVDPAVPLAQTPADIALPIGIVVPPVR
jgi:hypothetical protein